MHINLEGHIVKRFDAELGGLFMHLLEIGGLVSSQFFVTLQAMRNGDPTLIEKVLIRENEVNEQEIKIDREISSILVRRAPVARDLRAVVSISTVYLMMILKSCEYIVHYA